MLHDRRLMYLGIAAIGVLLPLVLVVTALAGPILGLGFIVAGMAGVVAWPAIRAGDHELRQERVKSTALMARKADAMAVEMGVPEVTEIRAPGRTFEAEVVSGEGVCPLLKHKGNIWKIDADGHLSAPLCSPSAAAISRLVRDGGQASGTSEHCVCPLGEQWVSFLLTAS